MKVIKLLFPILILLVITSTIAAQESEQKLYRIYTHDFNTIKNIESKGVTVYNSKLDTFIDIMAYPEQIDDLGIEDIKVEFIANNFKELIDRRLKSGSYEDYHDHAETMQLLNDFAAAFPEITRLDTIGYSVLGREICSIKISDNPEDDEDEIPILMVGCHHGNEILSVETTLFQIDYLLNNYYTNMEVSTWIDNYEIWYVPLVNPDGREDIRRTNDNGVDLNRNYDSFHTAEGNHGPYGFSEPETQAIRDLAALFPPALSLTYHTSGRLVLLPWTHTDEAAPDSLALRYMGNIIAESITFPQGGGTGHYELRQGGDWYFTAGEYCDYMYTTHNTFAYTVEMWTRQAPPADVIPEVIERNLEGMITFFRQAAKAGVTGRITDNQTGDPVLAKIDFPIIDNQGKLPDRYTEVQYGRYYKYLMPGKYEMVVSAPRYRTVKKEVEISADSLLTLDIKLDPAPDLQVASVFISDETGGRISGNNDEKINIGETAGAFVSLYNDSQIQANQTFLKVSTDNPNVILLTDSLYFGPINHFSDGISNDTLLFQLSPDCPDGETIEFRFDISDEVSSAWEFQFEVEAYTPNLSIDNIIIRDDQANGNGIIDNGETVMFGLEFSNTGRQNLNDVSLELQSGDQFFTVKSEAVTLNELLIDSKVYADFELELSPEAPAVFSSYLTLTVSSTDGYHTSLSIKADNIFGFFDDFENGINGWTHASYGTSSNLHDDWMLGIPQGKAGDPSSAYSGSNCWGTDLGFDSYLGDSWNGEYQSNVHNYLRSPSIDCSDMINVGIRYQRWLNMRSSDVARILVNETQVWKSSLRGHSDQEWFEHVIDISEIADGNPDVRIVFELESSSSNELGGWNIDDFLIANELASGSSSVDTPAIGSIWQFECYPNPFYSSTTIEYNLDSNTYVKIWITDVLGREVKTLLSTRQNQGNHSIVWEGDNLSGQKVKPGIYNISISYGPYSASKRVILLN